MYVFYNFTNGFIKADVTLVQLDPKFAPWRQPLTHVYRYEGHICFKYRGYIVILKLLS